MVSCACAGYLVRKWVREREGGDLCYSVGWESGGGKWVVGVNESERVKQRSSVEGLHNSGRLLRARDGVVIK
jgi:hypothetical protein